MINLATCLTNSTTFYFGYNRLATTNKLPNLETTPNTSQVS